MTEDERERIAYKLPMLNYGFAEIKPKERAQLILNDKLIEEYKLSTSNIAKIINVEEKDLLDFMKNIPVKKDFELEICVNVIMLSFILNQQ
ncbi:hypothetical protein JFL43_16205 [Viridibacillus sp. YIM B01967]|uniref:HigA2-like helix-turn-helix domain-containing protein n=2 Tax=Viridibacillus soli TaxID=2798301 RepID=A0ABS1HAB8_9BACL|nr:hypothetical protein [Viridibacillus soli]